MDQESQERLKEVLKDEAYVRELLATERPEDVQTSLEEKGIELTLDEISQIGEVIKKVQSGEVTQEQLQRAADGELTEDELEEVAGGLWLLGLLGAIIVFGIGGGVGIAHLKKTRW